MGWKADENEDLCRSLLSRFSFHHFGDFGETNSMRTERSISIVRML